MNDATAYTMASYPTLYGGNWFRSRLEARWAAFFDLLGWRYEYEPFDLQGWIPDFVLIGKRQSILVEVKPITHFSEQAGQKIAGALPAGREALLVGCTLPEEGGCNLCVGWLAQSNCKGGLEWSAALFVWYSAYPNFADFTRSGGNSPGRLTDEHDRRGWHGGGAERRDREVNAAWRQAAAAVQWRPVQ